MAFTEKQSYKIEVNEDLSIGVRRADIVLKDDVEVGRSYHRFAFQPGDDVSGEVQAVQDVAAAVWPLLKQKAALEAAAAAKREVPVPA